MKLKNAVVLITGGSSGLGKDLAARLKGAGSRVIITGRNKEKLANVGRTLGVHAIDADVANDDDIAKTFQEIDEKYGRIDCLVNNAGVGDTWDLVEDLKRENMLNLFQVNVFGAALMGAQAAERMKKQKSGTIVNIGSTAALKGFARGSSYASSKFALRGMTQSWQAELRPHNVRVVLVNPSEVPTAFAQEDRTERATEDKKLTPKEISDAIISALEMDNRGFIPELTVWATNPF